MTDPSTAYYARVSSDLQEAAHSIDAQLHLIRAFCDAQGITAQPFVDDGVTGMLDLWDRPAGERLWEEARAGRLSRVIVYKLDRLGRGLDARLNLNAVFGLEELGVSVVSLTESIDTGTPAGKLFLTMLAGVAAYDREVMLERMRLGKARVARAGQWWGGQPPYGYDLVEKRLVVNDEQAVIIRRLFRRVCEGASCVTLAQELNALGIPTGFTVRKCKGTRQDIWHDSSVRRILHSDIYAGEHAYQGRGESFIVTLPALVSREEWEATQEAITRNARDAIRNTRREYLLRGLLTCGACGWSYCGRTHMPSERRYYCCAGNNSRDAGAPSCRALSVRADAIERRVWGACRRVLFDPESALLAARAVPESAPPDDLPLLTGKLADLDAARARVINLYSRGTVTAEETDRQLVRLAGERDALQARRREIDRIPAPDQSAESLLALVDTLRDRLSGEEPTFAARREIIRLLVFRIVITSHERGRMCLDVQTAWGNCQL